ncbi:hypothetical protein J7K43_01475 [Candidatus Calescamantes bacterium]|nr:hypothetical protein [Candidatus Calescamantes bacterium]
MDRDKKFITEEIYVESLTPIEEGEILIWGERTEIRENGSTQILRKKQAKLAMCGHPVKDFQDVGMCNICHRYVCKNCLWICSRCGRTCCRLCGKRINKMVFCKDCLWLGILREVIRLVAKILRKIFQLFLRVVS